MDHSSLCEMCLHRRWSFCGALVGKSFEQLNNQKGWEQHRTARSGERVANCDQVSEEVLVLCKGWACRFFMLPDGRRQIFNFLMPGDIFSAISVFQERFSFTVDALTEIQITAFQRTEVKRRLSLSASLWAKWIDLVADEVRTADELMVALGRRTAEERVGYLLLHLVRRMSAKGLADKHRYRFPVNQSHIADTLGITSECVCRMLSRFRRRGILELSNGYLEVFDFDELERIGSPRRWS